MKDPIGLIFGDYWIKRRGLHIWSFVVSLLFSQWLYLAYLNVLAAFGINIDFLTTLTLWIYSPIFIWPFVVLVIISLSSLLIINRFPAFFQSMLRNTWNQIFQQGEQNRKEILLSNFFVTGFEILERLGIIIFIVLLNLVLAIISIPFGFLGYVFLSTWFIAGMFENLTLLGLLFVPLDPFIAALFDLGHAWVEYILLVPPVIRAAILIVAAIILIPFRDLIEANHHKTQRLSIRERMKKGVILLLKGIALPLTLAKVLFHGITGLFNHRDLGLDIPVINDRNVDQAFDDVLRTEQEAFVYRFANTPEFLIQEFIANPAIFSRVIAAFQQTYTLQSFLDFLIRSIERIQFLNRLGLRGSREFLEGAYNPRFIFGIGKNGILAYAIIEVGPPTRLSRFINRIWCSDIHVKEEIIRKIGEYEED